MFQPLLSFSVLTLVTNVKLNVTLKNKGAGFSKVVFFFSAGEVNMLLT